MQLGLAQGLFPTRTIRLDRAAPAAAEPRVQLASQRADAESFSVALRKAGKAMDAFLDEAATRLLAPARESNNLSGLQERRGLPRAMHTVRRGETLSAICLECLERAGAGPVSNADLYALVGKVAKTNRLRNPDLLQVGQRLDLSMVHAFASGSGGAEASKRAVFAGTQGGSTPPLRPARMEPSWQRIAGGGRISSEYGFRSDPFTGQRRFHHGLDIAAPQGNPIRPVASGKVVFSGRKGGYGNVVDVKHLDGTVTRYAHNRVNNVKVGDAVTRDTVIGEVGSTGRSTGPHVHFEVRKRGERIDPGAWLARRDEAMRIASR